MEVCVSSACDCLQGPWRRSSSALPWPRSSCCRWPRPRRKTARRGPLPWTRAPRRPTRPCPARRNGIDAARVARRWGLASDRVVCEDRGPKRARRNGIDAAPVAPRWGPALRRVTSKARMPRLVRREATGGARVVRLAPGRAGVSSVPTAPAALRERLGLRWRPLPGRHSQKESGTRRRRYPSGNTAFRTESPFPPHTIGDSPGATPVRPL